MYIATLKNFTILENRINYNQILQTTKYHRLVNR